MPNSSELSLQDLRNLEQQISFAEQDKAAVVYWHHNLSHFDWFRASDKSDYKEELCKFRCWIRDSTITNVRLGDHLSVNGNTLYPLEMRFDSLKCHAYTENAYYTPYLFRSQSFCQGALEYLQRNLINSRQT